MRPDLPDDLGDDNHRWGWVWVDRDGVRNGLLQHRCGGRVMWAEVDVVSGNYHTVVVEEPLHIEPSLLCPDCGDHGFIREGRWVAA